MEFDLLRPESKHPDIIINAYATNDMHINSLKQGDRTNSLEIEGSWREKVMAVLQEFIRLASSSSRDCNSQMVVHKPAPVILHLDDYLGNEQKDVLATTELSQAVQVLANYYGNVAAMSYPDMVRDWVYGDTQEFWFSPFGWYPSYKQDKSKMAREIHPGMPFHIIVPWIISYHFLNIFTTYCDRHAYHHNDDWKTQSQEAGNLRAKILENKYEIARMEGGIDLPALKQNTRFPGRPKVTPSGLPPPLSPELSLQDITSLWKQEGEAGDNKDTASQCTSPEFPKCPFAWVSGLLNDHNSLDEKGVENYFRGNSDGFFNHGWELKRHVDGKKMGYVPLQEQPGANLTVVFKGSESQPLRQIVLFYLKSYGERWSQSMLQIRIDRGGSWEPLAYRQLPGFHAKNTSEMYVERITLPPPRLGDDLRIRFQALFISGRAFKIMGLLACR